ncbi:MAG: glycosyltransferase family 39 protein [Planctomycetes bacterium]|nr:glycosyltransferase family 39 protein [Planctomycetota bacterium]
MPWSPRRNVLLLIVVTFFLRLCWAAVLELGNDEAYHYLYTLHPDWSYFDHPPMLMVVAKFGLTLCGGWVHPLSLRLGFILLFAGSTWILFDWTARWFGERAGFYAAFAFNMAAYYSVAAGVFVLPDGPFLFFALLTMRALSNALFEPDRPILAWTWVGVACAGAMASKYHAVLLPLGTLMYVIVTPRASAVLKTPGPYLAALLAAGGLVPVLIWNAQHDWASIAFQGGRAVGFQFSPLGLSMMLLGPIAYLLPWIWFPCVTSLVTRLRHFSTLPGNERLLICLSVVPLGLFFCVSCMRPILPHWPLIGVVPLFPLVGALWARNADLTPVLVRRWVVIMPTSLLFIAILFIAQARFGVVNFPLERDPAREISGWESVGRALKSRGILGRSNTFLFSNRWYDSGQLAFCERNLVPVACYNEGDARGFAYWSRPEDWLGKDGIFVTADDVPNPDVYKPYFQSVEPLATFPMTRSGKPFRQVHVFLCTKQHTQFPFAYGKRNSSTR